MDLRDAHWRVGRLRDNLQALVDRDPEQEVRGMALPVIDAVLEAAKEILPGDPVIATMRQVVSPEAVAEGEPLRAVDVLVVVDQLHAALSEALPPDILIG
jgi:hypothetical protein